jgi:hypothetical protein
MEKRRGVYRVLVGKPEVKRTLSRPSCRWEGNIKMGRAWTGLGWLRIQTGDGHL